MHSGAFVERKKKELISKPYANYLICLKFHGFFFI